jgi:hypothetical protein
MREKSQIWLDPLFWQALGKARGWKKNVALNPSSNGEIDYGPMWLKKWHSFVGHLAGGKDAESFFAELLK